MRTFGIIVVMLGIAGCIFAIFAGILTGSDDFQGLGAIAISIAAVGIVAAAAIILRNSRPN